MACCLLTRSAVLQIKLSGPLILRTVSDDRSISETSDGKVACEARKAFDNELCLTSRSFKIIPMNETRPSIVALSAPPIDASGKM